MYLQGAGGMQRMGARHGGALGAEALVLGKVVALACVQNARQFVVSYSFDVAGASSEVLGENKRQNRRRRRR